LRIPAVRIRSLHSAQYPPDASSCTHEDDAPPPSDPPRKRCCTARKPPVSCVSGVNYFSLSATTIFPYRRQLHSLQNSPRPLHWS
jgi:hypothetical protein